MTTQKQNKSHKPNSIKSLSKLKTGLKRTIKKTLHKKTNITYENYLDNTIILTDNNKINENGINDIRKIVIAKSFKESNYIIDLEKQIMDVLPDNHQHTTGHEWVKCINKCYNTTHNFMSQEMQTTAYYLKIITACGIGDELNNQFAFNIEKKNIEKITGLWQNDFRFFRLIIINPKTNIHNETNLEKGHLIMGLGPSASGKTFLAKKIIELMNIIDPTYPSYFLSLDGGIYRENSIVYQTIINLIKKKRQYSGLSNLVSTNFISGGKTIFNSNIIKREIRKYLIYQKQNYYFTANLYVPETAGGCIKYINCSKVYKDYIYITGDKDWIGLLIYQHKTQKDCPYSSKYKCSGTVQSGTERQVIEGKKYSTIAWSNSMKNGECIMNLAKQYRFKIHNSGSSDRITLFQDLSPNKINLFENDKIANFFKLNGWEYQMKLRKY
jgi:hypothetical protein